MALYVATTSSHLNLLGWLLEKGTHPVKPVGLRPYWLWCQSTAHQDTGKCLIQAAAESSQTLSLELFITKSILSLASRDPGGCKPLKIAVQHGHKDCALFAADKLGSLVFLRNMCLPIASKHLLQLGQNKAACNRSQHTAAACRAMLGSKLLVDGFNHPGSLRPN